MAVKKSELYSTLWKCCDELRGGMDASQYKDYVLVILFVKYISDKSRSDAAFDIEIPDGCYFEDFVALKGNPNIGEEINKKMQKLAEAIEPSNEEYAKANAAITVFQSIDAILNNKPEDKPVNKMLHLATSFISSVVKSSIKNDEAKRGVTITAIMVDLAIDFFCKK